MAHLQYLASAFCLALHPPASAKSATSNRLADPANPSSPDMPACIEKRDTGPSEPPRKKRGVSAGAGLDRSRTHPLPSIFLHGPSRSKLTAGKRLRGLGGLDGPKGNQRIPKKQLIDHWFSASEWSRERKTLNQTSTEMSQLPSPDATAAACSQKSTAMSSSRKVTASVHDIDYRATLEKYNIFIREEEPNPELIKRANDVISRRRETPELDDAAVKGLRATMRELQNKGEEDVKDRLGAGIIPGFNTTHHKTLDGASGQLWTKSTPVPLDLNILEAPLPLPKPKPDKAFAYAKAAFKPSQLATIDLLAQGPVGPSFASPHEGLRFPYLIVEIKSQAKDGTIRVARNQAAGAGAIALNGYLELMSRGPGLDEFDFNRPLFFSVIMDQEFAGVSAHWIGKNFDTNQHTFHLEELKMLTLKYDDSIHVLQRTIKNIHDYARGPHLESILDALDEYRRKIIAQRAAESTEKPRDEIGARAPPSPPQPPPRSKKAKGTAAPGGNGRAPCQTQGTAVRPGVRTRRMANLEHSQ